MTKPSIPSDPSDPNLTTREVAKEIGLSLRSVQLYCEAGIIRYNKTPGGHRRIRTSELARYKEKFQGAEPEIGGLGVSIGHIEFTVTDQKKGTTPIKISYLYDQKVSNTNHLTFVVAMESPAFYHSTLVSRLKPVDVNHSPWVRLFPGQFGLINARLLDSASIKYYPELIGIMKKAEMNEIASKFWSFTAKRGFSVKEMMEVYLFA